MPGPGVCGKAPGPVRGLPDARSTDGLVRDPAAGALGRFAGRRSLSVRASWRAAHIRVGRRHDYCRPPRLEGPRTRPWLLHGREAARGPDSEPLGPLVADGRTRGLGQ
ncbi:DUF6098 family protein [Streptomyces collinus]